MEPTSSKPDFQQDIQKLKEADLPHIGIVQNLNGTSVKIFKSIKELQETGFYHQVTLKDFATVSKDFSYQSIRDILLTFISKVPNSSYRNELILSTFDEMWFKAIESKNLSLIAALSSFGRFDRKDPDGNNIFHYSIKQREIKFLSELVGGEFSAKQWQSLLFEKNKEGKNVIQLAQEIPKSELSEEEAAVIASFSNWQRDIPELASQLDRDMEPLLNSYWNEKGSPDIKNIHMDHFNHTISILQQFLEYHYSEKSVDEQVMIELKSDLDILSNLVRQLSSKKTLSESEREALLIAYSAVQAQMNDFAKDTTVLKQSLSAAMSGLIGKSVDNVSLSRREGETKSQKEETAGEYQKRLLDYYSTFNTQVKIAIRKLNSLIQHAYPTVDQKFINLKTKLLELIKVIGTQIEHLSSSSTLEFEGEKKNLAEIKEMWEAMLEEVFPKKVFSAASSSRPATPPQQSAEEIFRGSEFQRIAGTWKNSNPNTAKAFADAIASVKSGKFPELEEQLTGDLTEQSKFISLVLLIQIFESPSKIEELEILQHSKLDELTLTEQMEYLPAAEQKKAQQLQKDIEATEVLIKSLKVPLKTDSIETQEQRKKQVSQLESDVENKRKEITKIIMAYKETLSKQMKAASKDLADAFKESQGLTLQDFIPRLLGKKHEPEPADKKKHEPTEKDMLVEKVFIPLTKVAGLASISRKTYNAISQNILSPLIIGPQEEEPEQDLEIPDEGEDLVIIREDIPDVDVPGLDDVDDEVIRLHEDDQDEEVNNPFY